MEENKNNAVEKVENAAENASEKKGGSSKRTSTRKKTSGIKRAKSAKSVKNSAKKNTKAKVFVNAFKEKRAAADKKLEEYKKQRAIALTRRKEKREAIEAEREKIRAEKRIELAKIRAHKKAEREKARAAALREMNRKLAESKARREQLRAEKQARRDMIKHETKKQREKRLVAENAQWAEERKQKRAARAELRKQKFLARKEARATRAENRQHNREQNKGFGGWLAAVISLGVATLVLASVLTFVFLMPTAADTSLESAYRKSFYDTMEQIENIDLNFSKILATTDESAIQEYLVDLAVNSELAENDLQQLPLKDENKFYTTKVINQIGDYAKYLNKKLINGETFGDAEINNLTNLYKANAAIRDSFQSMNQNMDGSYSFRSIANDKDSLVLENFNDLQNLSVEYPELIYDGPFSDGKDNREVKGLSGETVNDNRARDIFTEIFRDYGLKKVQNDGTAEGNIKCFNVQGEIKGELIYGQISETGGKLIMFAYSGSCKAVNYNGDECSAVAEKFLGNLGLENMKPVWINLSNNVYTINFAYTEGDVIVYSDLIKVRVCAETATVIGMEASGYYTNHTERAIAKPKLTAVQAEEKVSYNIDVKSFRLAIVPTGETSEKLCYEFAGEYDGSTYYVYIDATTGKQVEMFKVVKTTEGDLLL